MPSFNDLFKSRLLLIRAFFAEWFQHLTFQKSDPQYKQFLYESSKKWDNYSCYLTTILFTFVTFFGVYRNFSLKDNSIKLTIWIAIMSINILKKTSKRNYTGPFMFSIWCLFTYYCSVVLEVYSQDGPLGLFMLGYIHGILEMLVGLSISNIFNRLTFQICLLPVKVIFYWDFMLVHPRYFVYLTTVAIFLILYSVYYDLLYKKSFKIIYQSREKLMKFQTVIVDDNPSGVAIVSAALDSIIYANQSFTQRFKPDCYQPHDAIPEIMKKLTLDDFQSEELAPFKQKSLYFLMKETCYIEEQSKAKKPIALYAFYQKETPEECIYEIKIREIIWEDQAAFTIIFNDITDKQLARTLKIADEQKDRVIATVSHELRTPINGILGLLELVICQVTDKLSLTYLDHCKSCSKLLLHLVNSILDLSQIRHNGLKIAKENFNLDKCLEEVRSLYIYATQCKNIQFIIEKMPRVPDTISTDQHRLVQILINLLGNAIKFTFSGSVKLKVSVDDAKSGKILFEVEDTGIGIADKDKCKLFKMFGKLNQSNKDINKQGVGLGLTIANELVKVLNQDDTTNTEDHKIHFQSVLGKGSRFWFHIDGVPEKEKSSFLDSSIRTNDEFLLNVTKIGVEENYLGVLKRGILDHRPLRVPSSTFASRNSSPLPSPKRSRAASQANKRVLIVDDNPFNLLAASFIMQKLGFTIVTASHGQESLSILENSAKINQRFDMILMDIQMPLMDGLEASRLITNRIGQGEMYRVPIIGLTAQKIVHERDRVVYKESGMIEVLEKPLVEDKIKCIIQSLRMRSSV